MSCYVCCVSACLLCVFVLLQCNLKKRREKSKNKLLVCMNEGMNERSLVGKEREREKERF